MDGREFILRDGFVKKYIEGDQLPFSFRYGGKKAKIKKISSMKTKTDANATTYFFVGRVSVLEVRMTATVYNSHAVVDWNTEIINISDKNSERVSQGLGTDIEFEGSDVKLWHSTGDYVSAEGLDKKIDPIKKGITLTSNGRPCDGAFPYFRLFFEDYTVNCAVGWQAKWSGTFTEKNGTVSVKTGQAILDSYLKPGEKFKLSSFTLMFVDGGNEKAINDWRRYYFDCILSKPNGIRVKPYFTACSFDSALEFCFSDEKSQLECWDAYMKEGIIPDIWWIDAGWYDYNIGDAAKDWVRVGTWEVDKNRFPNGLKPIADKVHEKGTKFLLWLEPERVHIRTKLYNEHPEWLLTSPKDIYCGLLNLGNPDALEYISNHVNKLIKDNGVDIYREDFNCDPDNYFRDSETEDRQGALENLHCQGYLKFWDNILAANPGLWIDSCASGGRRNDIETMKRGIPLHYSDFGYGDMPVKDAFQQTMFEWLPYFKEQAMTWSDESDIFIMLGALSPFNSIPPFFIKSFPARKVADKDGNPFELHPETRDYEALEKTHLLLDIFHTFAKYSYGNFYCFTEQSKKDDKWSVMQFTCPKTGNGVIKALRFRNNPENFRTFDIREIDESAQYELTDLVEGTSAIIPGKMLAHNFCITLGTGEAVIYEYKKL